MPGSATTKTIRDGSGIAIDAREWDESGAGTGPYSAMPVLGDGAGSTLAKAEDAAATSGDSGIVMLAVRRDTAASSSGTDGDYSTINVDSTGRLHVTPTASGDTAHDGVDGGNPIKVGHKAIAGLSTATLVSAADRTDSYAGLDGAQIIRPHCGLEDIVSNVATCSAGANTSVISAQGSGIKFYLTSVIIRNAGAANGNCIITDGNPGTTKADIPFPASTGSIFNPPVPIPFSANTAVYADPSGSDNITVTIIGFKSKV